MQKRKLKLISCLAAVLMVTSNLTFIKAKAAEPGVDLIDLSKQMQMYNTELVEASARKAYANELKSREVKLSQKDDNGRVRESDLNPESTVRLIVETTGNGLSESISSNKDLSKAAANDSLKNEILSTQVPVKESIKSINPDVKFLNSFYVFSNSFSLEAKAKDIQKIRELNGVKRVTIANEYYKEMNSAVDITKASTVWSSKGLKGEGMVVAIIDTGIDVAHKDMKITDTTKTKIHSSDIGVGGTYLVGKGTFYTDKVPYGYNFADNNSEVKDTTSSMHGMHVAGIVGANASEAEVQANTGIKGAAPEVQLLAMKVFSNNPNFASAFADNITAAIEDSVAHGADVINMSLGASAGYVDPSDIEQAAIKKANDAGVVCVVSAGNSQYSTAPYKIPEISDTGIVGSPATAPDSLMVASYENTKITGLKFDFTSSKENGAFYYGFSEDEPNPVVTLNNRNGYLIEDCGLGKPENFAGKNLKGKIALVKRGEIAFVDKKLNAQKAGAEAIIIWNNRPGLIGGMVTDPKIKIPGMSITQEQGEKLVSLLSYNLKLTFKPNVTTLDNVEAKKMSSFTSWGPTPDLSLRPYLSTPGGNINSTVNNNKYENMSGTSMAAPHAAGLTALVMEYISRNDAFKNLNGKAKAELAKNLLVNTAIPSIDDLTGNSKLLYSPRRQGAGLANVDAALKSSVVATFTENNEPVISLKDIKDSKTSKQFSVRLKNYGKSDVTYNVKDASGVMTEQTEFLSTMSYDVLASGTKLTIKDSKVIVPANSEKIVSFSLDVTENSPKNAFLEGFIKFESVDTSLATLGIPYLAFNGDWSNPSIFDKPVWTGESIWEKTFLANLSSDSKIYSMGVDGIGTDGKLMYNPEHIAFNPEGKDQNNVMPVLSLLRNAKNLTVEVLDSNGNVVRKIANASNLRKAYTQSIISRSIDWMWDGKIYNAAIGKYLNAPEGQYSIKVSGNVDYEKAEIQTMSMPVKIDKTNVNVTDLTFNEIRTGVYNIKYKATDNLSGVAAFGLMVDKPDNLYKFPSGSIVKLQPDKDGFYNMEVNLGSQNHILTLATFDNAGNITTNPFIISNLQITEPAPGTEYYVGDFDLKFVTNKKVLNNVTGYEIVMSKDNGNTFEKISELDKFATSYRVRYLEPGKYFFGVKALTNNALETNGYISSTYIVVKSSKMNLVVTSPQPGSSFNSTSTVTVDGTVDVVPSTLKVNGVKLTTTKATVNLSDENGKSTGVTKDLFKFTTTIDKTKLVRGMNKIPVYAEYKDAFGNIIDKVDYAIDIYYEDKMPELTINNKLIQFGANLYDYVDAKDATYVVSGSALSYLEGYDLYINGEHKLSSAESGTILSENNVTKKQFSCEIPLIDRDPKIELRLVSKSGLEVKKVINIRRMDFPNHGFTLNSNIVNGLTVTSEIFTVGGKFNPNKTNMTLKINDMPITLSKTNDIFGKNIILVPGENKVKIEMNSDGNVKPEIREYTIIYNKINKTTSTFEFNVGEKQSDGSLLSVIPREQDKFLLKGIATDTGFGFKVTLAIEDENGYLLDENIVNIGERTTSGALNINLEVPVLADINVYKVAVENSVGNRTVKKLKVVKGDKFISDFGIFFNKPVYNGMMVKENSVRLQGSIVDKLPIFKVNGMNIDIDVKKGFNKVMPLSEGKNILSFEASLSTSPSEITTTNIEVISDTIAPVINLKDTPNKVTLPSTMDKLTVKGVLSDTNTAYLYINDKLVNLNDKKEFNEQVDLVDAVNKIHLVAQDIAGNTSEQFVEIYRASAKTAFLVGIKLNNEIFTGFNPSVFEYTIPVKGNNVKAPIIEAIVADKSNVNVTYAQSHEVPGTASIEVCSEDGTKKVTYTIHFVKALEVTLISNKIYVPGADSEYTATIKNNDNNTQTASLLLGLYDINNKLIQFGSYTGNVKSLEKIDLKGVMKLPESGKYTVKAMAWDSLQGMNLLTDSIKISN